MMKQPLHRVRRQASTAFVGLLVAAAAAAASAQHDSHEMPMTAAAHTGDAHAAHRMAMAATHYAVSETSYAIPNVSLLDTDENVVLLDELLVADRAVALNFIFTTCTTICPIMTATFAQMRDVLGEAADGLTMVSITIDPEYDRPAVLREYAQRFGAGPSWQFLTGDSLDIENVLRSFDVYAGSKMNHRPATLLRRPGSDEWIRIDGLASGADLAREVTARLLD